MKATQLCKALLPWLVVLAFCLPASAAITLYDKEETTFSVDGFFQTFYVYSSTDNEISGVDRDQARIKTGFLPNYIGFNFSKQLGDLKLGGRSSFWVKINDSDDMDAGGGSRVTDTGIDVRQFYGTIDGSFGQVLIGKDFGLFGRSNIFLDEILLGYGNVNDTLGLIDGGGVSFGNIGSGYIYPTPTAQITYRSPELQGFKLAIGLLDPSHAASGSAEENMPRIEAEVTYNLKMDNFGLTAWVNGMTQSSEDATNANSDVNSNGVGYGLRVSIASANLTASGYTAKGAGWLVGPGGDLSLGLPIVDASGDEVESDGFLLQGSYTIDKVRLVASYGKSTIDYNDVFLGDTEDETITGAVFYSVNSNLILVGEYNINNIENGSGAEEETKTIAVGAILTF
jgi:hypothetical protein